MTASKLPSFSTIFRVITQGHFGVFASLTGICDGPDTSFDFADVGPVSRVGAVIEANVTSNFGFSKKSTETKCEPDRCGRIRGHRHTKLDDTDINAQRHIRGALGGLVAGVIGDSRIFVSGGAEHQGPDGGGLIAAIAKRPSTGGDSACAS